MQGEFYDERKNECVSSELLLLLLLLLLYFHFYTAVYLVFKGERVSLTKHFLFTVLPKKVLTIWHIRRINYYCFLHLRI
jgi:hypothetical protein